MELNTPLVRMHWPTNTDFHLPLILSALHKIQHSDHILLLVAGILDFYSTLIPNTVGGMIWHHQSVYLSVGLVTQGKDSKEQPYDNGVYIKYYFIWSLCDIAMP